MMNNAIVPDDATHHLILFAVVVRVIIILVGAVVVVQKPKTYRSSWDCRWDLIQNYCDGYFLFHDKLL